MIKNSHPMGSNLSFTPRRRRTTNLNPLLKCLSSNINEKNEKVLLRHPRRRFYENGRWRVARQLNARDALVLTRSRTFL